MGNYDIEKTIVVPDSNPLSYPIQIRAARVTTSSQGCWHLLVSQEDLTQAQLWQCATEGTEASATSASTRLLHLLWWQLYSEGTGTASLEAVTTTERSGKC